MDKQLLQEYAAFAVRDALHLQKGQTLIIRCPIEAAEFGRLCAAAAYDCGAREVEVRYDDERLARLKMERTDLAVLEDVKPWKLDSFMQYAEGDGTLSLLRISSADPEIYKGLDSAKVDGAARAASKAMKPFSELTMANRLQWCIVAVPGDAWARRVFPGVPVEQAKEKLWDAIFTSCRIKGAKDVAAAWRAHSEALRKNRDWIQGLDLESLHLTAANGTDLVVGLADDVLWGGGEDVSTSGVSFSPNVPTEEVFAAPHRDRVDGVVKSSLPYVYNGNLIEGITARFEKGRVVEYSAENGGDLLDQMLSADEGAKHLGEIALVPASSPIRQSGVLFYNTLFDENAACHMAFGAGYPTTVKNGENMSREELLKKGVNDSLIHEDVMIGTVDMNITGTTRGGDVIQLFKNGEWAGPAGPR